MREPLRWLAAFGVVAAASALVGALTPLGVGGALFVAGAVAVFASIGFVRLGGAKTLVGRTPGGVPIFGDDPAKRERELRMGIGVFVLALALWAAAVAWAAVTGRA